MKKKVLVLAMSAALALSSLAGCGSSEKQPEQSTSKSPQEEKEGDGKPDHLVVSYVYMNSSPADLDKVQEAVNDITVPEINVEIEFKPLSIGDSFKNYSLWISSGETVDLMMLAFQDIKTYVNSGQIEELDSYISESETPTLYKLSKEFPFLTKVADKTYGMAPIGVNYGEKSGVIIREDWVQETGIPEKDIYSMDDLTQIFAAIKKNHPESYPFGVLGSSITTGYSLYERLLGGDHLGGNVSAGYLMDKDSTKVVNLFETKEYQDYLELMAKWYEAGYILPDAATTDTSIAELRNSGKVASDLMSLKPEQFTGNDQYNLTGLATGGERIGAVNNLTNWTVPITSSNPKAAVRFMDYLYGHSDLSNLITWGIEGTHFNVEDKDSGLISFPDGMDASNSPYYVALGFWGDRRNEYTYDKTATKEQHEEFTEKAMKNKFKSYGFVFDNSNVSTQMMACQTVLDQYQKALETGSLGSKWKETYETMVKQLKSAGIDQVIEECQSQFDNFLKK